MSNAGPSSSKYHPSAATSSAAGAAQPSEGFTAEMRDRQARGKDPYRKEAEQDDDEMMDEDDEEEDEDEEDEMDVDADDEDEDESGGESGRRMKPGRGPKPEPFEDRERRSFALSVLDNPEQLMMYAQSTGDSIPGQRRRFMAILCGFGTFSDATTKKTTSTPRRR